MRRMLARLAQARDGKVLHLNSVLRCPERYTPCKDTPTTCGTFLYSHSIAFCGLECIIRTDIANDPNVRGTWELERVDGNLTSTAVQPARNALAHCKRLHTRIQGCKAGCISCERLQVARLCKRETAYTASVAAPGRYNTPLQLTVFQSRGIGTIW
jgi:hypothetical protein